MPKALSRQLTYVEAIREALDQSLQRDERVIVIGEGVPDPKAIFASTQGLREKFGAQRVFDMPLAENGVTGICVGAAIAGMRPVMIHQRIDFALLSMDQLVNNAAKWHYMFNGKITVPLVVRMIVGRGWGQGPQHSQSLQAMFALIPGLRVVMPTTARDAKGMLISAIEDNNPVIFIEHRWLHHISDVTPEEYYRIPLDRAQRLHSGDAVTITAFSLMTVESLIAAHALSDVLDIQVDLLDMRSVRPLDMPAVLDSVARTHRLVVTDTSYKTGSVAGEIIAHVVEHAFDVLQAAPLRVCLPDHPTPTAQSMSEFYYPGARQISDAVLKVLGRNISSEQNDALNARMIRSGPHDVPNRAFSGPF
jgi:pyruvate dehydrogenase E1 component beta subunit